MRLTLCNERIAVDESGAIFGKAEVWSRATGQRETMWLRFCPMGGDSSFHWMRAPAAGGGCVQLPDLDELRAERDELAEQLREAIEGCA